MTSPLPKPFAAWRDEGRTLSAGPDGRQVFVRTAGPEGAPWLLVLHGFPSSSLDFRHVLPRFAERFHVAVHDHPGFGLSDKPKDYSYSLLEQADVALGVWRALGVSRGHVVAHDYGTSVATELLARRERGLLPIDLDSVTLTNGSVHIELAELSLSQRLLRSETFGPPFARFANKAFFSRRIRNILAKPVPAEEIDLMWAALERGGGRAALPAISQYLGERTRFWHRWIGALTRLDLPAHVLWGRKDPIAVPAIAEKLAGEIPGAELTWLDDLGHYPMLEDPDRWADAVIGFLDRVDG